MLAALFPRGLISRYEREFMRLAVSRTCVGAISTVLIFDPFVRFYLVSFNIIVRPAINLSSPGLPAGFNNGISSADDSGLCPAVRRQDFALARMQGTALWHSSLYSVKRGKDDYR